jgi:hypothetical protein
MANYDSTSAYYLTPYRQFYLDVMTNRSFPRESDDQILVITQTYQYRPDMLAFDLYDNAGLWWVFYQRNPNTLTKPPLDFKVNVQIYIPKITTLRNALGF